jgi:hypothetical protein
MKTSERIIEILLFLSAATAVMIVALIIIFLVKEGLSVLVKVGIIDFCLGMKWNPIAIAGEPSYGIFPMIVASFYVAIGSLIIAVPLGLACAVFLAEIAPSWARSILKHAIELLVGCAAGSVHQGPFRGLGILHSRRIDHPCDNGASAYHQHPKRTVRNRRSSHTCNGYLHRRDDGGLDGRWQYPATPGSDL